MAGNGQERTFATMQEYRYQGLTDGGGDMSQGDKVFEGSIPEIYDRYLVPLIFDEFANDLARRAAALEPIRLLETAAGSGVVTRILIQHLPPHATYTVTDLNQPMLDQAANNQEPDSRISWRQADALSLPFDDETFDVVVCQFGVMFYPDKIAGYAEAHRVLRPGGTLIFNVWDDIGANEFAKIAEDTVVAVFPDDPPQFLSRTPYGYYDEDLIRQELRQAGFANVTYETLETRSSAPSPRHPAFAFCQGTPLRNEIEARDPQLLDEVTDRVEAAIASRYGIGSVTAKIRGHIVAAVR